MIDVSKITIGAQEELKALCRRFYVTFDVGYIEAVKARTKRVLERKKNGEWVTARSCMAPAVTESEVPIPENYIANIHQAVLRYAFNHSEEDSNKEIRWSDFVAFWVHRRDKLYNLKARVLHAQERQAANLPLLRVFLTSFIEDTLRKKAHNELEAEVATERNLVKAYRAGDHLAAIDADTVADAAADNMPHMVPGEPLYEAINSVFAWIEAEFNKVATEDYIERAQFSSLASSFVRAHAHPDAGEEELQADIQVAAKMPHLCWCILRRSAHTRAGDDRLNVRQVQRVFCELLLAHHEFYMKMSEEPNTDT